MQAFFEKFYQFVKEYSQNRKMELTRETLGAILTMNTYLVGVGLLRPLVEIRPAREG